MPSENDSDGDTRSRSGTLTNDDIDGEKDGKDTIDTMIEFFKQPAVASSTSTGRNNNQIQEFAHRIAILQSQNTELQNSLVEYECVSSEMREEIKALKSQNASATSGSSDTDLQQTIRESTAGCCMLQF